MDMKAKIRMGLMGRMIFELRDKNGTLKHRSVVKNGITDDGYDLVSQLLAGAGGNKLSHIGIGDDNTAFDPAQTDLIGTSYRMAASYSHTGGTKIFEIEATWGVDEPIAGTFTVKEAAAFNAVAAGDMYSRLVRADLNKLQTDILKIIYEITLSNP